MKKTIAEIIKNSKLKNNLSLTAQQHLEGKFEENKKEINKKYYLKKGGRYAKSLKEQKLETKTV